MTAAIQDRVIRVRYDLGTAQAGINSLNAQLRSLGTVAASNVAQLQRMGVTLNGVGAGANNLGQRLNGANSNARSLNNSMTGLGGVAQALTGQIGGLNGSLTALTLSSGGASAGILAIAGALTFAISGASKYQDALVQITTLVDTTTFNMGQLSEGLKDQAKIFGQAPVAQAEAAYEIISSGASSAADAIKTLNAANILAAVGQTQVGVAANGLTSSLNAYAQSGLTAAHAADTMFITVRDGKISMEELSSSFGQVAPLAATLGVSIDEVGASVAALTLGGVQGSVAINNIRAAMTAIIKPSSEAQKLAKAIGLDFSSSALKAKGWTAFLDDVKAKTKGNQDQLAMLMGGVEALSATLALTTTASDSYKQSLDNMAKGAGTAADALKKVQEGSLSFQAGRVFADMKVKAIDLGEGIAKALVPAVRLLADNLDKITTIISLAMIPLATRMVVLYGTTLVQAVATFAATAAMRFASLAAAQGVLAASTATLSGAFGGLVAMFGGPWGLAIAGVGAGLYALYQNGSAARDMIAELSATTADAAGHTQNTGVQSLFAARGVTTFGGAAGQAANNLWNMAAAAKAAAVAEAKLGLQKANQRLDAAAGQTSAGLRGRWEQSNQMPMGSFGEIWERGKTRFGIIGDAIMKPSEKSSGIAIGKLLKERQAAVDAVRKAEADKEEKYLPPKPPVTPGGIPDLKDPKKGGKSDAESKLDRENDFWETLKKEVATAQEFGIEAQKVTKEKELQKILERELSISEKSRVDAMVEDIANAKAITDLKQSSAEIENKITVARLRSKGLSEDDAAIQDAIDAKLNSALNAGVSMATIQGSAYQTELSKYRTLVKQSLELDKQRQLLKDSIAFARQFSSAFEATSALADLDKQKANFVKQWNDNGGIIDGQVVSKTVFDSVLDGYNRSRAEIANKPLMDALGTAANGSVTAASQLERLKATTDRDNQMAALKNANLTTAEFERASREIARNFQDRFQIASNMVAARFGDDMADAISGLGEQFGGVFGDFLKGLGTLIDRMTDNASGTSPIAKLLKSVDGMLNVKDTSKGLSAGFDQASKGMQLNAENLKAGFNKLSKPLTDLKNGFDPASGGSFLKGMGAAVGGAMQGYEIGSTVAGIGKLFGASKNFQNGAKIGGAIGGITGNPIIAAGASVIGGIIGSIFGKKTKYQTAQVLGGDTVNISSRGKSDAASGAAGSVQKGLSDIASQLGGAVGAFKVSIGQYDGNWRVSTSGQTGSLDFGKKNKQKAYLNDFGKDGMEAAIAFAIQDAIKDGGITGIAPYVQNALQQAGADAAIALVKGVKSMTDELDAMIDPIGASARAIKNPVDEMIKQMQAYGATSADIAKLEQYKSLKLKEGLKSQLSSLTDFMDMLKGEGSGRTKLTRLNDDMAKFDAMKATIAAGGTVDQDAYTKLGQNIFSLAGDIYGPATSEFQDVLSNLGSVTTSLMDNITASFNGNDATAQAIAAAQAASDAATKAQTDTLTQYMATQNEYLRQIVEGGGNVSPQLAYKLQTMNGNYLGFANYE